MVDAPNDISLFNVIMSTIVAYLGTKIVLGYISLSFTLFVDDFDLLLFLVDISVFVCLYCLTYFGFSTMSSSISKDTD